MRYFIPFIVALAISYILTPVAKKIAYKVGAIDVPKDERRVHKEPIPRLGGLAIYFSTIASFIIFGFLGYIPLDKGLISIIIGSTIIVGIGVIDDIKPMPAKIKLIGQICAALVLVMGDIKITFVTNPIVRGYGIIELSKLVIPITVFWVVGITNTLNLIDGLDGLASGVGGIASISLLFVASNLMKTFPEFEAMYAIVMVMAAILAGASFGFLPYNFNPAKIFMGDTGALFLGFILSVISIKGAMKSVTVISVALPIVILGLPIFDTTFAILRRLINKRPIMEADKGHLHHRLLDRGLNQKQTVLILYAISITLGSFAILLTSLDSHKGEVVLGIVTALFLILVMQVFRTRRRSNP